MSFNIRVTYAIGICLYINHYEYNHGLKSQNETKSETSDFRPWHLPSVLWPPVPGKELSKTLQSAGGKAFVFRNMEKFEKARNAK